MRVSREISLGSSLHRASTDALIPTHARCVPTRRARCCCTAVSIALFRDVKLYDDVIMKF